MVIDIGTVVIYYLKRNYIWMYEMKNKRVNVLGIWKEMCLMLFMWCINIILIAGWNWQLIKYGYKCLQERTIDVML